MTLTATGWSGQREKLPAGWRGGGGGEGKGGGEEGQGRGWGGGGECAGHHPTLGQVPVKDSYSRRHTMLYINNVRLGPHLPSSMLAALQSLLLY